MKTLEQIEQEIGTERFNRWKREAELERSATAYNFKEAEAKHAFDYECIYRKYLSYKSSEAAIGK